MRYASTNKNFLSTTGLAVLGSLGIHGLLWAVLPGLPLNQAAKSPTQRTVGLVQLTPEEQSRLPQTPNPADTALPDFANQPSALPPLPPPPPLQTSVLPPLQLPPGAAPVYTLPPAQNPPPPTQTYRVPLPPPPQNSVSFAPIPYENIPSTPPNRPIPEGNIPSVEPPSGQSSPVTTLPSPPQVPLNSPINNGQPNSLSRNNGLPGGLTPDLSVPADATEPTPQQTPESSTTAENNPSIQANRLPDRGKKELLALQEQIRRRNQSGATTQPQTGSSRMTSEQLRLALRQQSDRSNTPPTQANPRLDDRKGLVEALRQQRRNVNVSNQPSEATRTALDNLDRFEAQRARVLAQYPNAIIKPPIRNQLETCDRKLDGGVAIVGVVVSPEGKIVSNPRLISKTGPADVAQATRYVSNVRFGKTAKPSYYSFNLKFDYDAKTCAQAQPQPTPNNTQPTRRTAPQPTPVTPTRRTAPQPTSTPSNINIPQPKPTIPIRRTTPPKTRVTPIQNTPQPTLTPRQRRIIVPTPQPTPIERNTNTRQRTPLTAPTSIPLPSPVQRNTPQPIQTPDTPIRQLTPSPQGTETPQTPPSNSEPTAD
ncbi:hypothetical protein [Aliterella atlantica]|uniref:Uncharacterized protein n=1 Tax=Aliterella atlantica CENA595 TaxID=1618023 RepID=A0A0D8ZRR9_9CYAN|nr:hypothetical protein [Aliterella atlantica]KJH71179.1 hypothetical protein UH38_14335 [Aliterella atlantica CENA595]